MSYFHKNVKNNEKIVVIPFTSSEIPCILSLRQLYDTSTRHLSGKK